MESGLQQGVNPVRDLVTESNDFFVANMQNYFRRGTSAIFSVMMDITPEIAATMLRCSEEGNRTIKPNLLRKYKAAMEAGLWEENGERIATSASRTDHA
jgi:hypothetical protein